MRNRNRSRASEDTAGPHDPAAPNLNYTASGPTSAGVNFTAVLEWPPTPVSVIPVQLFVVRVAARSLLRSVVFWALKGSPAVPTMIYPILCSSSALRAQAWAVLHLSV